MDFVDQILGRAERVPVPPWNPPLIHRDRELTRGAVHDPNFQDRLDPQDVRQWVGVPAVGLVRVLTDAEVDPLYGRKNGVRELYPEN